MHGLMKRGVVIISLLIISCLSFVGCGKKYISETKNMALPMTELRLGEANSKVEEILGKPDEDLSSESSSHLYYKYNNFKWKGKKGTLTVMSYDKNIRNQTVKYISWEYTAEYLSQMIMASLLVSLQTETLSLRSILKDQSRSA